MIEFQFYLIQGMAVGLEFVETEDAKNIVIDLLLLRIIVSWGFDP